jgi:outer membrane receptor protein involved in Fe transport
MNKKTLHCLALAAAVGACASSHAAGLGNIRFVVVDPMTRIPVLGVVHLTDDRGRKVDLPADLLNRGRTQAFDTNLWQTTLSLGAMSYGSDPTFGATVIEVPIGSDVTLRQNGQVPVKEITIHVTATRLVPNLAPAVVSGTDRTKAQIQKFVNTQVTDTRQLTKGQAGVTEDSAGQQHVRGEHTEITYVVDGVPLPDTLSGRAGDIVVPNTIQNLQIITGGFAPEFGGQVAAILNIQTISAVSKPSNNFSIQAGSYDTLSEDLTMEGPLGSKASYVVDLSANRTGNSQESQQPTDQTAHNTGTAESLFTKFHYVSDPKNEFTVTLSENPDASQIGNRTGLGPSFADTGQGYGFLGLRDANGLIPNLTAANSNLLGSQKMVLQSQQQEGMDINQTEVNEFGILDFNHKFGANDKGQIAFTYLHSGQDVTNNNPNADPENLPVDNSIEYNPTASRDAYHYQLTGDVENKRGNHNLKEGFDADYQTGTESYQIIPASQLALDELAAPLPSGGVLGQGFIPPGYATGQKDVNGNPVYIATGQSPVLNVSKSAYYAAAYAQDTWKIGHLEANYGFRYDAYHEHENISANDVNLQMLSPRVNLNYTLDKFDDLRAAYNRLFNTPPLSQGGIVGDPIVPETLSQYDLAMTRKVSKYQTATLAYYYKDIRDQVDVGLLVPGSEIGLYSAVNFQRGAVHGLEFSYDVNAPHGVGWDEYFNYTLSAAKPNGFDNTGEPAPFYNDHDQRNTIGLGIAYTWRSGLSIAGVYQDNSGLTSSVVPPSVDRTPRQQLDLHATTGEKIFKGRGGFEVDINNVFDSRQVINFQSGFSGTRFQEGRSITLGMNFHF